MNLSIYSNQQLDTVRFCDTKLIQLNTKWQEQLKTEKERVRRGLITGNYNKERMTHWIYMLQKMPL